uniref:ETFB lysine methyltransferase n=1 Tax=Macrostomum lignano TaxID=282301 RepID=A0A1I8GYU3_9PLAT
TNFQHPFAITKKLVQLNGHLCRQLCSQTLGLIAAHTVVCREHFTPELALRLITPECSLFYARPGESSSFSELPFSDPFWGFYWPGGQALARHLLDNPGRVRGRRVIDVGCGCGAAGIAALMAGAASVIFNDIDQVALEATRLNLSINQLDHADGAIAATGQRVQFVSDDLIGQWPPLCTANEQPQVMLIGDLFYSEEAAARLADWALKAAAGGRPRGSAAAEVLVGDPGRYYFRLAAERANLRLLARYCLPSEFMYEAGPGTGAVGVYATMPKAADTNGARPELGTID